jgi:NhaP-type Na+/H+ or K+/H+ antiporter
MAIGSLLFVLFALVLVFIVAYVAKYIVDNFFPGPLHVPILALVGLALLILVLWALTTHFGVVWMR